MSRDRRRRFRWVVLTLAVAAIGRARRRSELAGIPVGDTWPPVPRAPAAKPPTG